MYYKVLSTGRVENIDLAETELLRRALAPAAALPRHLAHQRGPRILQQSVAAPRLLLSCVVSFVAHSLCDASRTLRLPRSAPCAALKEGAAWCASFAAAVCCTVHIAPVLSRGILHVAGGTCSLSSIDTTEPAGGYAPAFHHRAGSRRCVSACTCLCACTWSELAFEGAVWCVPLWC